MPLSVEQIRQAVRFSDGVPIEPLEAAVQLENQLNLDLPDTLKQIHSLGGGAYLRDIRCHKQPYGHPTESCDLFALVTNPFEYYSTDVFRAYQMMLSGLGKSREVFRRVVPFGGDGGGGDYCLDYRVSDTPTVTKFYDGHYDLLARSFDEFVDRANPERRIYWESYASRISAQEEQDLLGVLPDYW